MTNGINDSRGPVMRRGEVPGAASGGAGGVERMRLWGLVLLSAALLCAVLQAASAMSGLGPALSGVGVLALVLGFAGSVLVVGAPGLCAAGRVDGVEGELADED